MDNRDRTTHHRPLTIQPDRALTEPRVEEPGRPATSPRPQPAPTKAADQTTTLETDRWIKAEAVATLDDPVGHDVGVHAEKVGGVGVDTVQVVVWG